MTHELDNCPFCGSGIDNSTPTPFPVEFRGPRREFVVAWAARCGNPDCGAEITAGSPELCAERWNRRRLGDVERERDEAREELRKCRELARELWRKTVDAHVIPSRAAVASDGRRRGDAIGSVDHEHPEPERTEPEPATGTDPAAESGNVPARGAEPESRTGRNAARSEPSPG